MKRRTFLATATTLGLGMGSYTAESTELEPGSVQRPAYSLDDHAVRFYSDQFREPVKVMFIADTHLWRDDARGEAYRAYSERMAGAYHETRHFKTGETTNPEASFEAALLRAQEEQVDLIILAGDIFSFPSEAAVEWVLERLQKAGIPFLYTAGNHDWHYEGMDGSLDSLRATWCEKRLLPMYQGQDPLMSMHEIKGIRFLGIDDSTYEIRPEQLDFLRTQVASGAPLVMAVHIPFYAPGRSVGFGCGHPEWGAASDQGFELERRVRWPEAGHTQTTYAFHHEVFSAPNLLGVFAGHIHHYSLDVIDGTPQFVTAFNAGGAYMDIAFVPHSNRK